MKGEFLSDIISLNDFKHSCMNIVDAPCGSGKTTFAINHLKKINPNDWGGDMLYLIDAKMGKEQLLQTKGMEYGINPWTEEEEWRINGIKVMTYAGYAMLCQKAPEKDYWTENSLILCDELQQAISWSKWNVENNVHKYAIEALHGKIKYGNNIVVAISATTDSIRKEFFYNVNDIPIYGEPRHYENGRVITYSELSILLNSLNMNERGVIFVAQIDQILKYKKILDNKGFKTEAIWSSNNTDYPLSEKQLLVREYIVKNKQIPEDINVLFINKSAETSISFGLESQNSGIDYMVIHTSNKDAQVQVRGRYRNDLKTLYLHDSSAKKNIVLDNKWLNRKLNTTDKDMLVEELNIHVNGRLLKWTSLKNILIDNGYTIQEKRTNKNRFCIIQCDKNAVLS